MKKFRISGWLVERRLAMGAISEVFLARPYKDLDQEPVILKRLLPVWRDEEDLVEAYAREGALGEVLDHPNMPHIRETGVDDGVPFLVMDYVEGESLSRLLKAAAKRGLPVPLDIAVAIVRAGIGVVLLAVAAEGYLRDPLSWWQRLLIAASAICLFMTGPIFPVIGLAVVTVALGGYAVARRKRVDDPA